VEVRAKGNVWDEGNVRGNKRESQGNSSRKLEQKRKLGTWRKLGMKENFNKGTCIIIILKNSRMFSGSLKRG